MSFSVCEQEYLFPVGLGGTGGIEDEIGSGDETSVWIGEYSNDGPPAEPMGITQRQIRLAVQEC